MEDFGLDLSSILSQEELEELSSEGNNTQVETQPPEKNEEIIDTENLSISDLFGSESVGNENHEEENNKVEKEDTTSKENGSSPNNIYSSIASAFKEDGIFSDLEDDDIKGVTDADSFAELVNKQIESRLDEQQQRIKKALDNNVEPSQIQMFENSIRNLNSITTEDIEDESDEGVKLRQTLIYNDYMNKGYSKDRALTLTKRAFDNNTDIEDAKEALEGNKAFYTSEYNKLLKEAEAENKKAIENRKKLSEKIKKSVLEDTKAFGEVEVDKKVRQKIFDVISKPVYKDPDTGTMLTELQKFEVENHADFMKYLGYFYVITDGFKSLNGVAKTVERKAVKKGLKELEKNINTTMLNPDGSFKFVSGVNGDSDTGGWSIDL